MTNERKEKIKSSAISWIVAIIIAAAIAVILVCAAHSKGMLKAKADELDFDGPMIGNIIVGEQYATEQYITPTGDCQNAFGGNRNTILVYYPVNGLVEHTEFQRMELTVNIQQGFCLLEFSTSGDNGWILYSKDGTTWEFDAWYIYIDNTEDEYSGNSNDDVSLQFLYEYTWEETGTDETNAQGTLESILGFSGNGGGGGNGGGDVVTETPTPANINDDEYLLAVVIPPTVPHLSGTVGDQNRMILYGFELSNAAQFTDANSRACPVIVQVLDNNGQILTTGEVSLAQQRNGQGDTIYYYVPLCPMMYDYGYVQLIDNAYQTRIRYKNATATDAWYTFDATYRTNNYTSIPNELWLLNNSTFFSYNQFIQAEGYDVGYEAGYQQADNEATVAMGIYKSMDIVSGVFAKIGEILDVRIFGSIPLYVFVLIPLIMGVVYVVLKFVR